MNKRTVVDFTVVTLAEDCVIRMRKSDTETAARSWGHNLGNWQEVKGKPSNLIARCANPNCFARGFVDRAESAVNGSCGTACHTKCPLSEKETGLS